MPHAAPFTVQTIDLGQRRHLMSISGDLEMIAADQGWHLVNKLLTPGAVLLIDVSRLGLLDSSGLRLLLLARREAKARGAALSLLGARPWLCDRLHLGGVLHLFDMHPNLSSALQAADAKTAERSER